ncbi:lysine-rich arabinogalactan protein 19-like [Neltuma alba]|uniref:lysine-rich arabinogalactan protein 19-like n=1 Tax=Neltuma alba TaxID=207710 RepID=UPI0010A3A87E|nr:lysine-rich arabinogalactan protein 19-like [Prosopis alba]
MESATIMKILLLLHMLLAFAVHDADSALPHSSLCYSPSLSPSPHDSPSPIPVPEVSPPSPTTLPPPPAVDTPALSPSIDEPVPVPEVSPPSPTTLPPPPPAPLLPQPPPVPQIPPPEDDPIAPPPLSCEDQCMLKCAEKKGFRRLFCIGKCLAMCQIFPPANHAGYQCTRDCVMNKLHHQQDIKSIDGLVNTCYNNCSENV